MKYKSQMEAHPLEKEHGYLGGDRKHIEKGHVPLGSAKSEYGTSKKLLIDDAGVVKKNKDEEY